jgi:endonuclease I
MQKSDLNILYPVLKKANSSRNNLKFGNVTATLSQPCPLSKRGHGVDGGKDVYFEVPDVHKGNVARAIFYFSVRYKLPISADEEASLRAWHRSDPVDEFERRRNETIYAKQHNRNPFVDHPELVELISDF